MGKKPGLDPKGIIPAVITPLDDKGTFNEKAMRDLINYLIDGGVHGLFVVGKPYAGPGGVETEAQGR